MASSKGTRFKKLIGSAIDFGTINFVFRLRTAINPKSLRFGVASTLETQTKQSLPCGFLGNLSLTCGFLVFQYIPCGFLGYLSLSCGFLDNLLMSCGFLDNLLIPCGFLGYQILSCGFLDSKQTSCGFLDVQQLACGFLVNITVSSGFVDNILPMSLARIGNISSEGDVLANEGAQSMSYYVARVVYLQPIPSTYQEQIQQTKSNIPTSTNIISTHQKKKGFLRTAPTKIQSSIHLRGSVRISHYVVYRVYEMHYILSLLRSGTSTISTKFHQALQIQIGF